MYKTIYKHEVNEFDKLEQLLSYIMLVASVDRAPSSIYNDLTVFENGNKLEIEVTT